MNKRALIVCSTSATCAALSLALAPTNSAATQGVAPKPAVVITRNLSQVRSGSYTLDHDHARVIWNISHHGYSTFAGVFSDVQGKLSFDAADPTHSRIEATVNMNSVGTLLPDFDTHLKGEEFLNTGKFPSATFQSTHIERSSANGLRVHGDLRFLGVSRPVVLDATFNQAGDGLGPPGYRVGFDGHLVLKRSDYGMPRSSIGDAVTLQIEAEFQPVTAKPGG